MKSFIKFIQEEVELEEANQVKMSALKLGDTVKLNKRFGGKQGTVKEVHPNGATVHVSGTETPVFAHHSNFTKIDVQKEEAELDEVSKQTLVNYMDKSKKDVKDMQKKYNAGKLTPDEDKRFDRRLSGQNIAMNKFHGRAKVPASGTDKAYDAAQKALKKEEVHEASNLRITKIYNKFPKKATYAVHSLDRKYFKEFDNKEDAEKHLESKKS